jgi:hypothetical protein
VLSRQQAAFARAFIGCGIATEAAREAGYSPNSIKQSASRVLNTPAVQAEIQRLREASRLTIDALLLPQQRIGETADALAVRHQADLNISAIVDRHYAIAAIVDSVEIALGRKPATITKVSEKCGKLVTRTVQTIRQDILTAVRGAELLLKHLGPANPQNASGPDAVSPELQTVIDGFREVARQYRERKGQAADIVDIEPDASGADGKAGTMTDGDRVPFRS